MSRARLALVGAVVGLIAACGGGDTGPNPPPPPPPPPTPASLAKQGGDNQTAEPGQAVATAPSVKVTSNTGAAVAGVTVTFAIASGGGTVTGATPTTGADGVATVGSWVLGTAGTNTLTATISGTGITGNPATFTANAQLASFNPTGNTTLTGTKSYASVTIPSGVTVTVTGSLVLNVSGPVAIAGTLSGDCTGIEVRATGSVTVDGLVRNTCTVAPTGTPPGVKLVAGSGFTIGTTVSAQDAIVSDGSIRISDPATENESLNPLPTLDADAGSPFSDLSGPFSPQNVSPPSAVNRPIKAGKGSSNNTTSDGPITINGAVTAGNGNDATAKSQAGVCDNATAQGGTGGSVSLAAKNSTLTLKAGAVLQAGNGGKGGSCNSPSGCPSSAVGGPGGNGGSVLLGGSSIVFEANVNVIRGNGGEGGDATSKGDDGAACTNGCVATATAGKGGNAGGVGYVILSPGSTTGAPQEAGADGGPGGRADATGGKGGDCATCPAGKGGDGANATATGGDGGNGATGNIWAIAPGSHHKGFGGTSNALGGNGGKGASCCVPTPQPGGNGGKGGNATATSGQAGAQGINAGGRGNDTGNGGNGGNGGDGTGVGTGGAKGTGTGSPNVIPDGTPGVDGSPCPGLSCTVTPAAQTVPQGGSGSIAVTVVRTNLTGALTGTVKDHLGNQLTTFTIPSGSNSATVSFTLPSPLAPGGPFTFTATVSGPGGTPTATGTFQVTISGGSQAPAEVSLNLGSTTPSLNPGATSAGVYVVQAVNSATQAVAGSARLIVKGAAGTTFYGNNAQGGGPRVGQTNNGSHEVDLAGTLINGVLFLYNKFKACVINGIVSSSSPVEVREYDQASQVEGLSNVRAPGGLNRVLLKTTNITTLGCFEVALLAGTRSVEVAKSGAGSSIDFNNIRLAQNEAPPPTGTAVRYCNTIAGRNIVWGGYTNDLLTWTQGTVVSDANGQHYDFNVSGTIVGGATVTDHGNNSFETDYYYGTPGQLASWGTNSCGAPALGTNSVAVNLTGLLANEFSWVSLGFSTATRTTNGSFTVPNMPTGTLGLFYSAISNVTGSSRGVGRSSVVVPTSSTVPVNLASVTAPQNATMTLNGMTQGRTVLYETGLWGPQGIGFVGYGQLVAGGASGNFPIQGVPTSLLQNGELHLLYAQETGTVGDRWYYGYTSTFGNRTSMLWPYISGVTRSCASTGVPARFRTQGSIPSEYTGGFEVNHEQTLTGNAFRALNGHGTYEVLGGTTLDWTSPTFSGANYNGTLWGLQPNIATTGSVTVYGSNLSGGTLYGAPVDGLKVYATDMVLANLTCP